MVVQLIDKVITILSWLIVIRVLLSWVPMMRRNRVVEILYEVTEPMIRPFRRFQIGGSAFALDLSPFFALLALNLIRWLVYQIAF